MVRIVLSPDDKVEILTDVEGAPVYILTADDLTPAMPVGTPYITFGIPVAAGIPVIVI
jgi:hypothetical protein